MQNTRKKHRPRFGIVLICILFTTACSSPVVLGTIYNGAPKRITKAMKGYAKFTKAQENAIDQRFAEYHQWHRNTQLPLYSGLLREVAQQLGTENGITHATVTRWTDQAGELSLAIRQCNPLNQATDFWSTLSETQVAQIKQKTADINTLRVKTYNSETTAEKLVRRHKNILSWAKRAGIKFNSSQSDLLSETLSQQINLGSQRLALWKQWTVQFNELLANQNVSGFTDNMNNHVNSLWSITETNYPDEWQASEDLWANFLHRFMTLQTAKQNQALRKKTTNIANTLEKISRDSKTSVTARCFDALG